MYKYISCFSGIGGLEASHAPELFCEIDENAIRVLNKQYPNVPVWTDICTLKPPTAEVVAGGWPCQDLSIAGKQEGLKGLRSGLLRELTRVAREADASTIVAENVTNLLRMRGGEEFEATIQEFVRSGFTFVSWRVLNARQFGLPQNRSRLIIIASKNLRVAKSLFREIIPNRPIIDSAREDEAAGFYWTAGTHSINYTKGYVPTIKIGSSIGIASPPAVHYQNVVRLLSPTEALALQGFQIKETLFPTKAAAYKAAGNAVAKDIGRWVMDGIFSDAPIPLVEDVTVQLSLLGSDFQEGAYAKNGLFDGEQVVAIDAPKKQVLAKNLSTFLDTSSKERLSARAAKGLIKRLAESGHSCPPELRKTLEGIVQDAK